MKSMLQLLAIYAELEVKTKAIEQRHGDLTRLKHESTRRHQTEREFVESFFSSQIEKFKFVFGNKSSTYEDRLKEIKHELDELNSYLNKKLDEQIVSTDIESMDRSPHKLMEDIREGIQSELEPFWDEHKKIALSQVVPPPQPDISSLLSTYDKFDEFSYKHVFQLFTIFEAILEIVYKSNQVGAGIKNILLFLDTREETEFLGKLFEYDGDVTIPFNRTNLNGVKLGEKKFDKLHYPYTSKLRLNGAVYSDIHRILAEKTRITPVVYGTTDIMRDGVDAPFDVVLQFLKQPSKFKDCTPEKIMETWYSRAGRVGRYKRTGIAYTFFRSGIDDHAAAEFIKIGQQQGDAPMQLLLDAKARHEKQNGNVDDVEGGESSSKS